MQKDQNPYFKLLDAFARNSHGMELNKRISENLALDPQKLPLALVWAKNLTFEVEESEKLNSYLFLIYSDLNYTAARAVFEENLLRDKPDAPRHVFKPTSPNYYRYTLSGFQALLIFELMVLGDAARCQDPVVMKGVNDLLKDRYEKLGYAYKYLPEKDIKTAWEGALQFETITEKRPQNADICSNDIAIGLYAQQVNPEGDMPEAVVPGYIADEVWKKERAKIRSGIKNLWQKRYAAGLKMPDEDPVEAEKRREAEKKKLEEKKAEQEKLRMEIEGGLTPGVEPEEGLDIGGFE
ncbi:MAG: hypothetical protein ACAH80_07335 [Alphaproteobacteria bacterium]